MFNAQFSAAPGPKAGRYFTVQDTSASQHTLPKNGLHLVKVQVYGGAHCGSLIINYAQNRYAHFPVSDGGYAEYDVDWVVTGNNIASAVFTTDGTAPAAWTLTFAEQSWGGPSIDNYLAIRCAVTAGGAESTLTAMTAVSFDAGESIPTRALAFVAAAAEPAAFYWPGEPGFQGGGNCMEETFTFAPNFVPAPNNIKPANNITISYTCAAGGLITVYVFYKPA